MHGISDEDWEDYLCDRLPGRAREEIEAHLATCQTCREVYERVKRATRLLWQAGADARRSLAPPDGHSYRGMLSLFTRVVKENVDGTAAHKRSIQARLERLELVLGEMCGAHTAAVALSTAARSSPARSLERLTAESWQPFLKNLTLLTARVCGEFGAQLVWESGQI
jgi:anti-sigma factor RsiW